MQAAKQYVALVIAHELAHQWFGNLVTMEWWTDLWLNEGTRRARAMSGRADDAWSPGFASWMEYHAVNELFPEWHIWTQVQPARPPARM